MLEGGNKTLNKAQAILSRFKRKWRLYRGIEIIMLSLGLSFFICGVLKFFLDADVVSLLVLGSLLAALFVVLFSLIYRLFSLKLNSVAAFLDEKWPELENSTQLVLLNEQRLRPLQKIQQQKVAQQLIDLKSELKVPHHIGKVAILAAVLSLISWCVFIFDLETLNATDVAVSEIKEAHLLQEAAIADDTVHHPEVVNSKITISPPKYTNAPRKQQGGFDLEIPEGSVVHWRLETMHTAAVRFIPSDSKVIPFQKEGNVFVLNQSIANSGFYHLQLKNEESIDNSAYYRIKVIPDSKPEITISGIENYTRKQWKQSHSVSFNYALSDDYGLSDAILQATISRGKGENVKFRELTLSLDKNFSKHPRFIKGEKTIQLDSLDILPGDELYFYIQATDNKTPRQQIARSDTYFIAMADTVENTLSLSADMGVDQMPEYFRSQRQIIIDTEKLMKEKPEITTAEFQERCNALGIDQKLLRLRYGQFLGEEFESAISQPEGMELQDHDDHSGHDHDDHDDHDDGENTGNTGGAIFGDGGELLESYFHKHDEHEVATFFSEEITALLKTALQNMWESELRLRTNDPASSLPYQYEALALIKEIQQQSRVYVERAGFEPPLIKEAEKRLTGDLDEAVQSQLTHQFDAVSSLGSVRVLAALLSNDGFDQKHVDTAALTIIEAAGASIAALANEMPGRYLPTLELLNRLADPQKSLKDTELILLRKQLWQTLPENKTTPDRGKQVQPVLYKTYREKITYNQ